MMRLLRFHHHYCCSSSSSTNKYNNNNNSNNYCVTIIIRLRRRLVLLHLLLLLLLHRVVAATTTTAAANNNNNNDMIRKFAADAVFSTTTTSTTTTIPETKVLHVHVIPHTHDDIGWRKTVDQYYYGYNTTMERCGNVNEILTTTIEALLQNSYRTMIYSEMKFFTMWYNEQSQSIQDSVRYLLSNEQLVFVNGGWCMHDEATTHYISMIDQLSLGHQFIYHTFGSSSVSSSSSSSTSSKSSASSSSRVDSTISSTSNKDIQTSSSYIPKVSWQIDPFGHSSFHVKLIRKYSSMNSMYFGRIDYQDLYIRHEQRQCEGLWNPIIRSSSSSSSSSSMNNSSSNDNDWIDTTTNNNDNDSNTIFWGLTGSYNGNYGSPNTFCFDILCDPSYRLIDINSTELLQQRIIYFLQQIKIQSDRTIDNHIMITMGEDFTFRNAHVNYANIDLLISSVMNYQLWNRINITELFNNTYHRINIFYSNPDYYTKQKAALLLLHQQQQQQRNRNQNRKRNMNNQQHQQQQVEEVSGTEAPVWQVKTDDFFPYADCPNCYWTGYYTSRSAFKRYERVSSSILLAARQIDAYLLPYIIVDKNQQSNDDDDNDDTNKQKNPLYSLEDAIGIAQHHDAVAGTAKQHVADDYSLRLSNGTNIAIQHIQNILLQYFVNSNTNNDTTTASTIQTLTNLTYCPLLNETLCDISLSASTNNDTVMYVFVYNSLAHRRSVIVRLPVADDQSTFRIERVMNNNTDSYQSSSSSSSVGGRHIQQSKATQKDVHHTYGTDTRYELIFNTVSLPPIGAVVYRITKEQPSTDENGNIKPVINTEPVTKIKQRRLHHQQTIELRNGLISTAFDISTGLLTGISTTDGIVVPINQTWGYYTSFDSNIDDPSSTTTNPKQNSGAYIFRPSTPDQQLIGLTPKMNGAKFIPTPVGIDVYAYFEEPWVRQITRIYNDLSYIEIEYSIGPIPIDDGRGKEIVSRFTTPIRNDGIFYTDSNGREFQKRKRNYRPTWDLNVTEPIAGNYYPVNAAIYIEDADTALSIMVDRSQGGASIYDGSIELMIQRRTLMDDSRGVDEPLNETCGGMTPYPPYGNNTRIGNGVVIIGKHRIRVGSGNSNNGSGGALLSRMEMDDIYAEPLILIGSTTISKSNPVSFQRIEYQSIYEYALPSNIMLLTFTRLHDFSNDTYLIRFGHQYETTNTVTSTTNNNVKQQEQQLSKQEIDLCQLFMNKTITSIIETTITGTEDIVTAISQRIDWNYHNHHSNKDKKTNEFVSINSSMIVLEPMDIRTFRITML